MREKNLLLDRLERTVEAFNGASLWRGACTVWDQRMFSGTFDRWLYLRLHKWRLMGCAERAALSRLARPGAVVVDVGSNLGLYTVLLSRLVGGEGRLVSFEPDPATFALLRRNCSANGCTNVSLHNQALGRKHDRTELHTLILNSGDSHVARGGGRLFRRKVLVEVVVLDEVAPDLAPDLIKIDIQGWELEALRGMTQLIARNPETRIYFEFWPQGFRRAGYPPEEVIGFLADRGFAFFHMPTGRPLDKPAMAILSKRLTGLKHVDILATRSGRVWPSRAKVTEEH